MVCLRQVIVLFGRRSPLFTFVIFVCFNHVGGWGVGVTSVRFSRLPEHVDVVRSITYCAEHLVQEKSMLSALLQAAQPVPHSGIDNST